MSVTCQSDIDERFALKKLIEDVGQIRLIIIPSQAKLLRRLRRIPALLHGERFVVIAADAAAAVGISRAFQLDDIKTLSDDPLQTGGFLLNLQLFQQPALGINAFFQLIIFQPVGEENNRHIFDKKKLF